MRNSPDASPRAAFNRETVELLRKLALTSILALISPGSAGQVVVGLLLAFLMLVLNLQLRPFSESSMNFVNIIAQARASRLTPCQLRAARCDADACAAAAAAASLQMNLVRGMRCVLRACSHAS